MCSAFSRGASDRSKQAVERRVPSSGHFDLSPCDEVKSSAIAEISLALAAELFPPGLRQASEGNKDALYPQICT